MTIFTERTKRVQDGTAESATRALDTSAHRLHPSTVAKDGNGHAQDEHVNGEVVGEWFASGQAANGDVAGLQAGRALRLLLVDPLTATENGARTALEVVAATLRRLGAWPIACSSNDPESVDVNIGLVEPAAVVIVLEYVPPRRDSESDPFTSCERAAQLAKCAREARVPAIAVNVGSSAAVLAACVEQGAIGLFDLDSLGNELSRIAKEDSRPDGHDRQRSGSHLPAPFDALVHLTPSERRVLFQMMEGRSASEIASRLVVSVTTVRSHIRSILRKFRVKSQLAAVALAFGTVLDQASSN